MRERGNKVEQAPSGAAWGGVDVSSGRRYDQGAPAPGGAGHYGSAQHEPGVKLDAGKPRAGMMIRDFARALEAVAEVSTYGAAKYCPGGWRYVDHGVDRYTDAMYRHLLAESWCAADPESGLLHAAHAAWGALARLELIIERLNRIRPDPVAGVPAHD